MKILRLLGRVTLGLFTLAVLLYLIAVAINWRDEPPSAAALKLAQVIADRPAVPASENASVYLLGFCAPVGMDPLDAGTRRMAWLEKFDSGTDLKSDPLRDELGFSETASELLTKLRTDCGWDADRLKCATALDAAADEVQLTEIDALAVSRYGELLKRRAWREVVPLDLRAPIPRYGDVMHAQRLYELQLMRLAAQGNVDAVRQGLSAEFAYWRGAISASDNLLAQMIAVAAFRNHFFSAQRVLRRLPAEQAMQAIPSDWSRELSRQDISMLRVIAGEYAFTTNTLRYSRELFSGFDSNGWPHEPSGLERAIGKAANPLIQLQATSNLLAEDYLRVAEALSVPLDQYQQARAALEAHSRQVPISMYNPVGIHLYRSIDGMGTPLTTYVVRVASVEGWRRAALLTANLRARDVAFEAAAAEVAVSKLLDPFTRAPFVWDAARHSVVVAAPAEYPRHREEYFY